MVETAELSWAQATDINGQSTTVYVANAALDLDTS